MQRKILILLLLAIFVGLGFLMVQQGTAQETFPDTAESIKAAKARVDFHAKTPKTLPFRPSQSFGFTREVVPGVTGIDLEYVEKNAKDAAFIRVTTINSPIKLVSDAYPLTTITLPNGATATFLDNGDAQILTWTEGQMSYQIVAGRPQKPFTAQDLGTIAANLE